VRVCAQGHAAAPSFCGGQPSGAALTPGLRPDWSSRAWDCTAPSWAPTRRRWRASARQEPRARGSPATLARYSIKQTRLRAFVLGICATLIILATLVGVYATMFNDERVKNLFVRRQEAKKLADEKGDAVRMAFAMHAQEAERDEQERDSVRMLKRITSKIEHTFDEFLSNAASSPEIKAQISGAKKSLIDYGAFLVGGLAGWLRGARALTAPNRTHTRAPAVNHELKDFKQDIKESDLEAQARLKKLSAMQEQSMRELLTQMSDFKLEELDDMLDKLFKAARAAPEVVASDSVLEEIEEAADSVASETMPLAEGKKAWSKLSSKIKGVPSELQTRLDGDDGDDWAEALYEIIEFARLSSGRKEILKAEEQWTKEVNRVFDVKSKDVNAEEDQGASPAEVAATVDAVISLHRLVSEGKVPFHLLDFESLNVENSPESFPADLVATPPKE
jgi:hypothetical protein